VWVVNAYMLTFGGCLLLGGRLGDLYGHRRMFLAGIALFTLASAGLRHGAVAGDADRGARGAGLGGAVVSAISLSLIMNLFTEPAERAKAMGVYGFVCAGGGSIGVLLGGLLTGAAQLALDLPGQPADRRAGAVRVPGAAAGRAGAPAARWTWPARSR
jgi:MFS family permease